MTSEDEKPINKQFLRVQREDDEDTWISGEELKTEGSSGSDDEAPRRKISPRKSRRRRSEGYNPQESRLSLPNLSENKTGIAFRLSKPSDLDEEPKSERFTICGGLTEEEGERCSMDAAMARVRTSSSLDKTCEMEEYANSETNWRPKRASPSRSKPQKILQAGQKKKVSDTISLPELEKKKTIRFCDKIEEYSGVEEKSVLRKVVNGFNFDALLSEMDVDMDALRGAGDLPSDESLKKLGEKCLEMDDLDDSDIEQDLLRNLDCGERWKPKLKRRLNLPNFDDDCADQSVKHFVSEMNEFYNEMSGKLKSLKNCPVLEDSKMRILDPEDEKFMEEKNFRHLYKDLKKTPQVKKTLSLISKMDSDISETISRFGEERAQRLDIQRQLLKKIPRDRESQLFMQLCDFEAKSNDNQNTDSENKKHERNKGRKLNGRTVEEKNFIERNIELAKLGMNFSLSDEQKQRLEIILQENKCTNSDKNDQEILTAAIRKANNMPDLSRYGNMDDVYQNCTVNAYRLSDDHKGRLIEIDSALQAFDEGQPRSSSESNIGVDLVRSLKDIDQKLNALSATYIHDEELLEKNKKKTGEMDIDKMEEEIVQSVGNKTSSELNSINDLNL